MEERDARLDARVGGRGEGELYRLGQLLSCVRTAAMYDQISWRCESRWGFERGSCVCGHTCLGGRMRASSGDERSCCSAGRTERGAEGPVSWPNCTSIRTGAARRGAPATALRPRPPARSRTSGAGARVRATPARDLFYWFLVVAGTTRDSCQLAFSVMGVPDSPMTPIDRDEKQNETKNKQPETAAVTARPSFRCKSTL